MTHSLNFGFLILLFLGLSCSKENQADSETFVDLDYDTIEFAHSMKGWEVYCWPNGETWNFSLLPGTNRLKSYKEVMGSPYRLTGLTALEELFANLPDDEHIILIGEGWLEKIWEEPHYDLQLPPVLLIAQIKYLGEQMGLHILVSDESI